MPVEQPITTLRVSTKIVLLDVAVVDKKGHPATSAFQREDFAITEDGRPQRLISFRAPSLQPSTVPTVFVLDKLNTAPADKAYYLICLQQYLRSLPEELQAPAELMVLSASGLAIAQPPTRNRAELLSALSHLPPTNATLVNLDDERLSRTLNAMQSIALESLGNHGKTAVLWLGPGYGIDLNSQPITNRAQTAQFIRYMVNTLLESRVTLYVVFPPDFTGEPGMFRKSAGVREASIADPYDGGINFRTLAMQTGGSVYTATNDLVTAMRDALALGRGTYALGYRPDDTVKDGRFRKVEVMLRNSKLRVVTKSGYYAPEQQEESAPQTIQVFQMLEAGESPLPFHGIPLRITHIDRSSDGKLVQFTVLAEDLPWQAEGQGESLTELTAGGVGLSKEGKKLSSSFQNVSFMVRSQDADVLHKATSTFKITLAVPANVDRMRLVVSSRKDGRLGCVDVDREAMHAATVTEQVLVPGV